MTTATTGTGTITLGSAVSGYLSFSGAGVSDGEYVTYGIKDGTNSEVGVGLYTATGTTLTRTVITSTNSNAAISLSGNAEVFVTASNRDIGPPTGSVFFMATTTVPTGYLECDGTAISRSTYPALFATIGTTFGAGDGSTTFNLPDLRGYFIRGYDHGRGVDSGRTFGSTQADDYKAHTHNLGGAIIRDNGASYNLSGTGSRGDSVTATSSSGGTETRPKNIALMPCIKY